MPADEHIIATPTPENIIPGKTGQIIALVIPAQRIVKIGTFQSLDIGIESGQLYGAR